MPDPVPPSFPDPPANGLPGHPLRTSEEAAGRLDRLLGRVPDDDERLADLVAARATGTVTAADRAEWDRLTLRMTTDTALRARVEALTEATGRLTAAHPDPVARFEALVAPAPAAQAAPGAVKTAHRLHSAADRAPSGRVREARPRWRVGALAGLALLAVAVGVLRVASPRLVDPSDIAPPEVLRGSAPVADDPQVVYDRAAAHLARAERSVLGISLGVNAGRIAAARAALDTVVARTPADAALHLDALYLRGVACEASADRSCAQFAYAEVYGRGGPRADHARAALERLAR